MASGFRTPLKMSDEVYAYVRLIDGELPAGKTADYLMP
jgi:hypothetical protein